MVHVHIHVHVDVHVHLGWLHGPRLGRCVCNWLLMVMEGKYDDFDYCFDSVVPEDIETFFLSLEVDVAL